MTKTRLGFLVSHRGTNMQAVIDACKSQRLYAEPAVVISNNSDCPALKRALPESIPAYIANSQHCTDPDRSHDDYILDYLRRHKVDLVVLAGYMKKVGSRILCEFADRIINIHPSLLPKYGGHGMFGSRVHEAVLAAGDRETGATVHVVNAQYDQGRILAQTKVRVEQNDTPTTLAARVLQAEHKLLIETLDQIIQGQLNTESRSSEKVDSGN